MTDVNRLNALVDLASERFGAMVEYATDDFFAEKENLIKASDPVFIADKYTDHGKWMDGWESRRRRTEGHDWCVVRLGLGGVIHGVVVDTSYFTGNFPESCSIEATSLPGHPKGEALLSPDVEWIEILPRSDLRGDGLNRFDIDDERRFTHLRLHIYPDGGVARLRVLGECVPDWPRVLRMGQGLDLAAAENGGRVLGCNDSHYGQPINLIMPGRGVHMGDGWETRRSRGRGQTGHDWVVLQLAAPGAISTAEVDTNHFKGNYPDRCELEATNAPDATTLEDLADADWRPLLPQVKLRAHTRHFFQDELTSPGEVTHVRLKIFPDGGVSRLRLYGHITEQTRQTLMLRWLNTLADGEFNAAMRRCCGASRWADQMALHRPYADAGELIATADAVWADLGQEDWLEAFDAHPRIGESKAKVAQDASAASWSRDEQEGVATAADTVKAELAEVNRAYEERFGYIYIVCASGKSADEMLEIAKGRLNNDPEVEIGVAAEEQRKITALRLGKLLEP